MGNLKTVTKVSNYESLLFLDLEMQILRSLIDDSKRNLYNCVNKNQICLIPSDVKKKVSIICDKHA